MSEWEIVYEKAIRDDGSLFFPERLTYEFLEQAKRHMGTQFFSNQYQNEVIGDESKPFKKQWLRYYPEVPNHVHTYAFLDPSLGKNKNSDYTAIVVVSVDHQKNWYLRSANRYKMKPPEVIDKIFEVCNAFDPMIFGIEQVAFQEALVYMAHEEMEKRNVMIPVQGLKRATDKTKEMRILSLIPRFEWGSIFINKGLYDFETEYLDYAGERSQHDDIMDALASIDEIVFYPSKEKSEVKNVPPNHPDYERQYRERLAKRNNGGEDSDY